MIEKAADWHSYCRAEFGVRSMRTLSAFHALCQAYVQCGRRIDELNWFIADEWERFQSRLIQGPDGHVFWDGRDEFYLNGSAKHAPRQRPVYYWWQRLHGTHPYRLVTCEVRGCVSPYHARKEDVRERREQLFPEHAILGILQVWSLQHSGQVPTKRLWDAQKLTPSTTTIGKRFGSFDNALLAAGLEPPRRRNLPVNRELILEHLFKVAQELGRWPDHDSYRLAAIGRYVTPTTIRSHFGSFATAREQARALHPAL